MKERGECMKDLMDYSLHSHFEIRALWTANYHDLRQNLSGVLTYQKGEMTLTLFGDVSTFKNRRMLYGFTEEGHFIWLPSFNSLETLNHSVGFSVNSYKVSSCFIFEDDATDKKDHKIIAKTFKQIFDSDFNDFKIKNITFSTNHLLEWVGQNIHHDLDEKLDEVIVPYGIVKSRNFELTDHLSLRLQLNQELEKDHASVFVHSKAEVQIENKDNEMMWFQHLRKEVLSFVKLVEFLGGRINQFQYIRFEVKAGIRGSYIFEQHSKQTTYSSHEVHTTFKDVEDYFGDLLLNYGYKRNKLDLIIDDYLSEFYLEEFYETKLLNSIRNLEIYHRHFVEPRLTLKVDEAQEVAREKIIAFINENLHEKYQGRFRSQIYYRPEKSLRKRLDFLLKNLPDEIFEVLNIQSGKKRKSRSIGSFVHRIVETRHYFTHGDFPENYPNRLSDMDQVKRVNNILRKICLYYIYQELGIADNVILKELVQ